VIGRYGAAALFLLSVTASPAGAQEATYRGFMELRAAAYPQTSPRDADRITAEGHARLEFAYKPAPWLSAAASADARFDNLDQVERRWSVNIRDRGLRRPALSIRQAVATLRSPGVTVDVGKQFIRWGKTDILTPTDRLAPRDFMEVTGAEFLAVSGARVQYTRGIQSLDLVAVPFFTPSRIPLLDRRWADVPASAASFAVVDGGVAFPTRTQFGARWSVTAPGLEASASYFDGDNHLPEIAVTPLSSRQAFAAVRSYAPLRMVGGDAAAPLRWATIKGEAAFLTTTSAIADDVVMYVVQIERQSGELSLVGGYAGEAVTRRRSAFSFSPDRGLTRAMLVRASYTLDTNRSVALEAAVRQNGKGVWLEGEYSHASGAHWRTTVTGTVIGGSTADFFGQYRRNSHLQATLRYSF
jgi:hypothetical protein